MNKELNSPLETNIQNLQTYCNLLKSQGYTEAQINHILQEELSAQQEAFINDEQSDHQSNQSFGRGGQQQIQQYMFDSDEEHNDQQQYEENEGVFEEPSDSHYTSEEPTKWTSNHSEINKEISKRILSEAYKADLMNQQKPYQFSSNSDKTFKQQLPKTNKTDGIRSINSRSQQYNNKENNYNNAQEQHKQSSSQQSLGKSASCSYINKTASQGTSKRQVTPLRQDNPQPQFLQDLKRKLRSVFTFYASFGDRINVRLLKSNKFHKLMSDAQLKDSDVLTSNRLDLMFVKQNSHKANMDFNTFLELLAQIATVKFSGKSPAEALQLLIHRYFLPLYEKIMEQTDLGQDQLTFNMPIDQESLLVLKEVQPALYHIYKSYFQWELSNCGDIDKVTQQSENAIFIFLKDFEICPSLVTKSTSFLLFQQIIDHNSAIQLSQNPDISDLTVYLGHDSGTVLSFWRFSIYIIRIAEVCYKNLFNQLEQPLEGQSRSAVDKTTFILERMELSQGFLKLNKKGSSAFQSLILKKRLFQGSSATDMSSIQRGSNSNTGSSYNHSSLVGQQQQYGADFNNNNYSGSFVSNQGSQQLRSQQSCRLQRSRSDLRLRQATEGLSEDLQAVIRNYSPMGFTNPNARIDLQNRQILATRVKAMKNYRLLTNPAGLVEMQCAENIEELDEHCESLLNLFGSYCSFGDAMNTTSMTSAKFMKLLREAELATTGIKPQNQKTNTINSNSYGDMLYPSDVDLIFIKAIQKKQMNSFNKQETQKSLQRMSFEQFIVALEMVAGIFYNEDQYSFSRLIQEKILPLNTQRRKRDISRDSSYVSLHQNTNTNSNCSAISNPSHSSSQPLPENNQLVQVLLEILKNKDIVDILGLIHKTMAGYFKFYSESKLTIDFERFVRFAKDFGIFPTIISKQRLLKIFSTLAQIYHTTDSSKQQSHLSNNKYVIDQHLFIEAIALCAFEVPYVQNGEEPSDIEKICLLIERMNQSGGQIMITKQTGHTRSQSNFASNLDIAQPLRKKFPQFFQRSYQPKNAQNFDTQSWRGDDTMNGKNQMNKKSNSNNNLFDECMMGYEQYYQDSSQNGQIF